MNFAITAVVAAAVFAAESRSDSYFEIKVIDEATGRGVPLIELRTVNDVCLYTDSGGVVAFDEPGLMNQSVFFSVQGHGYELGKDGFGFRGRRFTTVPGGSATIEVKRMNVAERLYRVTGGGIYAESLRLGRQPPIREPLINGQVIGSDSIQAAVIEDRIHWFWGDTIRPSYPLGNYHAPGATSKLPGKGGLDPNVGVDLEYFIGDDGFAKATCKMPGDGPTWIDGMAVTQSESDKPRLFAHYLKVKPPLTVYRHGIAEFNHTTKEFEPRTVFPDDAAVLPSGHSFDHVVNDTKHIYFAKPFPIVRVAASAEAVLDPNRYESFTCLAAGSSADDPKLDRDEHGNLRFGWKAATPPLTPRLQNQLVSAEKMKREEGLYQIRDIETNKPITIHHGSVNWNPYRKSWLLIASENYGTSVLGEVWYSEADSPQGPWSFARKIVTHDKQSFYNPRQHPFFDQQGGRIVYFEGTYTHSFSGNDQRTPRYEYNQIMYRLDLSDVRLNLPVAIYRDRKAKAEYLVKRHASENDPTFRHVAFWGLDRPQEKSVPIFAIKSERGTILSTKPASDSASESLFHALPPDLEPRPAACAPLFEWTDEEGNRTYEVEGKVVSGYQRAEHPLCIVWACQD